MQINILKDGETYVFRVRAQNKAGVSKPSEPTEPVLAETKPGNGVNYRTACVIGKCSRCHVNPFIKLKL